MTTHTVFPPDHRITVRNYRKPVRERHHAHAGPYYWTVGDSREISKGVGFYLASRTMAVDAHGSSFALRLSDANEHLTGRLADTSGYFTDEQGDSETLKPIVARLPRSRGFLAGWTMGNGMASTLDTTTIHETAEDAARAAHYMAESDAEKEREYQARESARLEAEDAAEALKTDAQTLADALKVAAPVAYAALVDAATPEALHTAGNILRGEALKLAELARYVSTRDNGAEHKQAVKDANRTIVTLARALGYSYPRTHATSF
jgi:hypothetical protein